MLLRCLVLLVLFSGLSCRKKNETLDLLSRNWKLAEKKVITPLTGTPLQGSNPNWYSTNTCEADRIWMLSKSKDFLIKTAGACTQNDPNFSGKWALEGDYKVSFTFVGNTLGDFKFDIIELSEQKFRGQRTERVGVGGNQVLDLVIEYGFIPVN